MHAQMDAIEGLYDVDDVIARVSEKLDEWLRQRFPAGAGTARDALPGQGERRGQHTASRATGSRSGHSTAPVAG